MKIVHIRGDQTRGEMCRPRCSLPGQGRFQPAPYMDFELLVKWLVVGLDEELVVALLSVRSNLDVAVDCCSLPGKIILGLDREAAKTVENFGLAVAGENKVF